VLFHCVLFQSFLQHYTQEDGDVLCITFITSTCT